jgi:ClpP class serine protease
MFREWVIARRGDRLRGELFTGEVWTGTRALELGLIDGLGTARAVLGRRFPDADLVPVEGRKSLLARLGLPNAPAAGVTGTDLLLGLAEAARIRAIWTRYDL